MSTGMRRGWQIATGLMLLICVLWAWQSVQLSLFDRLGPGPGFFPFWLALIGAALAVAVFVQVSARRAEVGEAVFPRGAAAWRPAAVLVTVAIAGVAMEPLGFRLAMLLFNVAILVALGERRWWGIALFAVGGSFGVYYVFNNLLDVILPIGMFGI